MMSWLPLSPVNERTGLIRWVFDIPTQPGEPQIFNASVKMANTVCYTGNPCYDSNGGSGLTREAARGAAIGEGLERYCSSVFDPDDLLFGTFRALSQSHRIIPPERYALFHPEQPLEIAHFDRDTPIAWVWGFSLTAQEPVLVPASLIYIPYYPKLKEQGEQVIGPAVSSGLACAQSYDEALLKGICEVVERDAFMITWLDRLPMPQVNFESHPELHRLYHDRLKRNGLSYTLINMTTDIDIPSFLCILVDDMRSPAMICVGGAANLNPVHAASKAMMEAVQTREWAKYLGENHTFSFASDFRDIRTFEDHVALYAYGDMGTAVEFLVGANLERAPLIDCWESQTRGSSAADLETALRTLSAAGVEAVAIDLTTPDVADCGYCVTKILIPEFQPLYADYLHRFLGGTRLYEVPQRLGYASAPRGIADLNPFPHPFP